MTQRKPAQKGSQPLVSVIIPVYNAEKTIARCLNSLLNQTIADQIEIIAIDDGSTDGSLEILQSYKNEQVKVMHIDNVSIGQVRNLGVSTACGKYIGFVDADDYVVDEWGPTLEEHINSNDDVTLIVFRYYTQKSSELIESVFNQRLIARHNKICNLSVQDQYDLIWGLSPFVWDKLFLRDVITSNNTQFPATYYAEDAAFVTKYINDCSRVALINKPLCVHIDDNNVAMTKHISESWGDILPSMADAIGYYKHKGVYGTYEHAICMVTLGLYKRRLVYIAKLKYSRGERRFIKNFINKSFQFFDANFRDSWSKRFKKWWPNYSFMTDKKKAICYTANAKRNNRINTLVRKTKQNKTKYAYYRKYLPIRRDVVLAQSFWGETSDSPYYFARGCANNYGLHTYLASNDSFQASCIVNNDTWVNQPDIIKINSKEYVKLLATAKYIICNDSLPAWFNKRPGQILVNTWHGTPLKTLGKDMASEIGRYVGYAQNNFLMSDYLLYPNDFTFQHMSKAYYLDKLYSGTSVVLGYPRNVALFDRADKTRHREYYGLVDKRIFVYMPTWRVNPKRQQDINQYTDELIAIFDELDPLLNDNTIVYVKLHHLLSTGKLDLKKYRHIAAVDPLIESYQFLNMADCLITDYSSVMFDFAASGRSVVLFGYDYDAYLKDRGVYIDIDSLPFDQVQTAQQLARYINSFTPHPQHYDKQTADKFWKYDSSNNARKLCQLVLGNKRHNIKQIQRQLDQKFNVIFAPSNLNRVEEIVEQLSADDLLVFYKAHLSGEIERFVKKNMGSMAQLLVAQPMEPITIGEHILRSIYRKTGLLESLVKNHYRKEISRILPHISVKSFTNHSHIKRFADIARLFPDGVEARDV